MEKTISLEASKELQDVMPDKTKYAYRNSPSRVMNFKWYTPFIEDWCEAYKTLTLTEAIDMLPNWTIIIRGTYWYRCENFMASFCWKTLLEAVEKMLLHLHKKWLLTK